MPDPTSSIDRRTCLALAAAPLLAATPAQAQGVNVTEADLKAMKLRPDGVSIDFPPLADTGFSVPLQADIVAPAGLRIASIDVYLPENPNTRALRLRLAEPVTRYSFTTRLRLAGSQDAWWWPR